VNKMMESGLKNWEINGEKVSVVRCEQGLNFVKVRAAYVHIAPCRILNLRLNSHIQGPGGCPQHESGRSEFPPSQTKSAGITREAYGNSTGVHAS